MVPSDGRASGGNDRGDGEKCAAKRRGPEGIDIRHGDEDKDEVSPPEDASRQCAGGRHQHAGDQDKLPAKDIRAAADRELSGIWIVGYGQGDTTPQDAKNCHLPLRTKRLSDHC